MRLLSRLGIPPTLLRASLGHLRRHPWQIGLTILGVALGVAVVVAIDVTNASARRAFDLSTEALTGKATHQITAGPGGLDEEVYRRLRVDLGLRATAPVVEGYGVVIDQPGRVLRIIGIDALAEGSLRPHFGHAVAADGSTLMRFLTTPGTAILGRETAAELGLEVGDRLALRLAGGDVEVELCARIEPTSRRDEAALGDVLLVDLATAQEMLDRLGELSRVDLALDDHAAAATVARIEAVLPPGASLGRSATRSETMYQMTRAFRLNLLALSLLALVVGMFLVYNTMTFSVVQRRTLLGRLRALGTSRRQVFALVLGEALLVGLVGTAIGLVLGVVLATGLVRLVTQTINDLYFVLSVRELSLTPLSLAKGVGLGVVASVLAALAPAREATLAPPRLVMSRAQSEVLAHRAAPRAALAGLGLLLAGTALLFASREIATSFAALFAIITGFALAAPYATLGLMAALRPVVSRAGIVGRMAVSGVAANLSRTGVAIAALTIAVSVTVGVGVMIHSFRDTVIRWLGVTLQADLYIAPMIATEARSEVVMSDATVATILSTPGVSDVSTIRATWVDWDRGDSPLGLAVIQPAAHSYQAFDFQAGEPTAAWTAFDTGTGVLVTEPLAYRHRLAVGDRIELAGDRGPVSFEVAGVVRDYGSDQGAAMIDRDAFLAHWGDDGITGVAVMAADGHDLDALQGELRARLADGAALEIRSNRELRQVSLEIFDRTFTITSVLRLLATGVAFIGVLASLMALALERSREIAVLRANGLTPRQVLQLVLGQTALMGLAAGLLSIVVGMVLAVIMIFVINRRSFGWSLDMTVDPWLLGQAIVIAVGAALLAGLYPARRMARTEPALALREE